MKPTNNIPAYRFQGYTDAWELRKLGDEVYFYNGRAYKQSELLDFGKYKVVRVGNFNTNEKWYYSNLELEDSKTIDTGDLIYLWATSFGPEIWKGSKSIYHYHIWKLIIQQVEKIDKNYLYMWLYQDKNKIAQNTNGSTMVHITKKMIESRDFMFPTLPEQSAIGTFFSTLDQHITLHQRKLDTLKEQKKTYLKLLFPAKGKNQPALRFRGFEDDWKEVKLGEIVVWEKGSGLSKSDLNIEDRGGKVIHYADLYRYKEVITEIFHSSESIEGKAIPLNSLLFPMSDVTPQGLARASSISIEGVRAGGDILIANIKDNSSIFLSYQVNANYRYILPLVTGTTVRHISSTSLSTIPISLPSLPEQEAIGTFFQTLDQEIAQVEDKLASLKEMKKTLLRKLFVS